MMRVQGLVEYLVILALMVFVVMSIAHLLNPDAPAEPKNTIDLVVAYSSPDHLE